MKVLVICHNQFSTTHNNGKTLSAIFSSFRKEELCQLYFTPIGEIDTSRCDNYYCISDKDAIKSVIFRNKCGIDIVNNDIHTIATSHQNSEKAIYTKKFLRSIIWFLSSWYHGGLSSWLKKQKPNLIFYVGGDSYFSHVIANTIADKLKIPLASYFTDDYVINTPDTLYNWFLKKYYSKTVSRSSALFGIGKAMADDYSVYYHKQFYPIMNIIDIPRPKEWTRKDAKIISINYYGGLHLGRAREIIRFAQFLDHHAKNVNTKFIINIYSFSKPSSEETEVMNKLRINVNPALSGAGLKQAMLDTDVFLHVESIEDRFHSLTKLSVSTKIPEYMSMQKPIIAFGPADVASFKVIADSNSSLVIDDIDNEELMRKQADQLLAIVMSDEKMKAIARDNYEYAKNNFDKKTVSLTFRKQLEGTIDNYN